MTLTGIIGAFIYLLVAGVVFWLLDWLIRYINPPEPFAKVARVVLAIVAVLFVIEVLLRLTGAGSIIRL